MLGRLQISDQSSLSFIGVVHACEAYKVLRMYSTYEESSIHAFAKYTRRTSMDFVRHMPVKYIFIGIAYFVNIQMPHRRTFNNRTLYQMYLHHETRFCLSRNLKVAGGFSVPSQTVPLP